MDNAAIITSNTSAQTQSTRDILAMLSMIDYLIAQTSTIDAVSTRCLMMARESLAGIAGGRVGLH